MLFLQGVMCGVLGLLLGVWVLSFYSCKFCANNLKGISTKDLITGLNNDARVLELIPVMGNNSKWVLKVAERATMKAIEIKRRANEEIEKGKQK